MLRARTARYERPGAIGGVEVNSNFKRPGKDRLHDDGVEQSGGHSLATMVRVDHDVLHVQPAGIVLAPECRHGAGEDAVDERYRASGGEERRVRPVVRSSPRPDERIALVHQADHAIDHWDGQRGDGDGHGSLPVVWGDA